VSRSAGADRDAPGPRIALFAAVALALLTPVVLGGEDAPRGVLPPLDPASNPSSEAKVELGRKLFGDVRLSTDRTVACAT